MMDIVTLQIGFIALISLFFVGAIGALVLRRDDAAANPWTSFFAAAGSAWGLGFSLAMMVGGYNVSFAYQSFFPLFSFAFHIDALSAFFVFTISLISLFCSIYGFGYVKHFYKKYDIGALGFFYNLFIMGMLLVVTSSNALLFLIVWEIMSIASYFLVVYDRNQAGNVKAGFLYLIMTQAGTACIALAFLLLYKFTGSFDFSVWHSLMADIPLTMKNIVFALAIIGFGTKAGIIPFHIWLPEAHPAAPSHVSALMSGVMIKTGIYMMIRLFLCILWPIPLWWGIAILILGAISSLLGVLYALAEHDIKRLLAYHSIENIGIILLGLGSCLVFYALGMPTLALLGLAGALFHTLNHATFKSLLFLGAGSVINQTHTRNIEEYGGLIKLMPYTALFFLVGSMAISALPPFNGFASEWLTFQSLFLGIASTVSYVKWTFLLAAGSLAFTGGLALACFVKVFGTTFLARPRSSEVSHAKESSTFLVVSMGALAVACLLLGIFGGYIGGFLQTLGAGLEIFQGAPAMAPLSLAQNLTAGGGFGTASPMIFFVFLVVVVLLVALVVRFAVHKNQKIVIGQTWDCGTDLKPRMEITSTGFARSIVVIFKRVLRPSVQHDIQYHDADSRYLVKQSTITLGLKDVYQSYFYGPLRKVADVVALQVKKIQSGDTNLYILYIFIALVVSLFFVL